MRNQTVYAIGYLEDNERDYTFIRSITAECNVSFTNDINDAFIFDTFKEALNTYKFFKDYAYTDITIYKVTTTISLEE